MKAPAATPLAPTLRIDKLLFFLRLFKSRSLAQKLVGEGHIRLNGKRVERAHQAVGVGDLLVVPVDGAVRIVRVLELPDRRGTPAQAQACYEAIQPGNAGPGGSPPNRGA